MVSSGAGHARPFNRLCGDNQKFNQIASDGINFSVLYQAGGELAINYTEIDGTAKKITELKEGEWIRGFIIDVDEIFTPNSVAQFNIFDGSRTLLTLDKIMGKLGKIVVQEVNCLRKYRTADTLYYQMIQGSATPAAGNANVVVLKLKKEV